MWLYSIQPKSYSHMQNKHLSSLFNVDWPGSLDLSRSLLGASASDPRSWECPSHFRSVGGLRQFQSTCHSLSLWEQWSKCDLMSLAEQASPLKHLSGPYHILPANITLAKVSHLAKPEARRGKVLSCHGSIGGEWAPLNKNLPSHERIL